VPVISRRFVRTERGEQSWYWAARQPASFDHAAEEALGLGEAQRGECADVVSEAGRPGEWSG